MSKIEWTEKTWNPVTGCTKLSAGCKNCYAEKMAKRLQAMGVKGYEEGFELQLVPKRLNDPFKRKKPTVYFVCSMSDIFHEGVPFSYTDEIMDVIRRTPQHTYQILTKRANEMSVYLKGEDIPANMWVGVTVENRDALHRIDHLRAIDAPVKFLSIEPLLEDLVDDCKPLDLTGIDWVIIGGESGSKARPMEKRWVEKIIHRCQEQDVTVFFKQWGMYGEDGKRRSVKRNGHLINGKEIRQYPEVYHQMLANKEI